MHISCRNNEIRGKKLQLSLIVKKKKRFIIIMHYSQVSIVFLSQHALPLLWTAGLFSSHIYLLFLMKQQFYLRSKLSIMTNKKTQHLRLIKLIVPLNCFHQFAIIRRSGNRCNQDNTMSKTVCYSFRDSTK